MSSNTGRSSKYERRVQLALKWYHLDHLEVSEIQDRFEEEGYGSFTQRTIKGYINSKPSEEVLEQIRERHAATREQIAEREEQAWRRAREAEMESTRDEPLVGMVPEEEYVDGRRQSPKEIPYEWEVLEPGHPDWPDWGDPELDTIIRFTEGMTLVEPGQPYPKRDWKGEPVYHKEVKGLQRDQPDRKSRSFLRREQTEHLEAKGEAMGIYEESIHVSGDLSIDSEITVPDEIVQAVIQASQSRLKDGEDGDE